MAPQMTKSRTAQQAQRRVLNVDSFRSANSEDIKPQNALYHFFRRAALGGYAEVGELVERHTLAEEASKAFRAAKKRPVGDALTAAAQLVQAAIQPHGCPAGPVDQVHVRLLNPGAAAERNHSGLGFQGFGERGVLDAAKEGFPVFLKNFTDRIALAGLDR